MKLIFKTIEIPENPSSENLPTANPPTHQTGWCRLQKESYVVQPDETDLMQADPDKALAMLDILLNSGYIDRQLYRRCLKVWGQAGDGTWATYSATLKAAVAQDACCVVNGDDSRMRTILGNSWALWNTCTQFDLAAQEARHQRYSKIKSMVIRELDQVSALQVNSALESNSITGSTRSEVRDNWVKDGWEGVWANEDLFESIIDYANATTFAQAKTIIGSATDPYGAAYGKYETIGIRKKLTDGLFGFNPNSDFKTDIPGFIDLLIDYIQYGYNCTLIIEQN